MNREEATAIFSRSSGLPFIDLCVATLCGVCPLLVCESVSDSGRCRAGLDGSLPQHTYCAACVRGSIYCISSKNGNVWLDV